MSRDLVHWTELEPAFWEEGPGVGVQSGSCVVDVDNTSGLARDPGHPALVAFWSRFDNRSQCLSYSLDKGRTWTRYAGNPIFEKAERDPQVFWYGPRQGGHWTMVMYGEGAYHILNSPDLLHWTDTGHPIPDSFECPDLFPLPLDGDPAKLKWVLIQGNGQYSVGEFDGRAFHEETKRFACDLGPNFYATQSWHGAPDRRRIQAAWMRGAFFPGMPFNQQVTVPCEMTLHSTLEGPRLYRRPIHELTSLEGKPRTWTSQTLRAGEALTLATKGELYRLRAEVEIPEGAALIFSLRGESVALTAQGLASGEASGAVRSRVRSVDLLLDRGSIETFVNDGELSSTRAVLPQKEGLFVKADGGPVVVHSLSLTPMRSAWH